MKTVIRFAAMIVAISLIASCLFSCDIIFGKDPTEMLEGAEAALASSAYTVDMGILYETEDPGMQEAVESLSSPIMKLTVDGKNLVATMSLKLDGRSAKSTYTVYGGVIYVENYEETADGEATTKTKSPCSDEIKEEIIAKLGDGANLRADDFEKATARTVDGVTVITCSDLKKDTLRGVVDHMQQRLASIEAVVAVKDADLAIQVRDGKYDIAIFTCTYVITTETDVYNLKMTYASQFDYASEVSVAPPADADEYIDAPFI